MKKIFILLSIISCSLLSLGQSNLVVKKLYIKQADWGVYDTTNYKFILRNNTTGELKQKGFNASMIGGWSLLGNAGTTSATNFIGTTDAKSLAFRTNNVRRMIIDSLGNVGIGTTTPTERLDIYQGNINFLQATDAGAPLATIVAGGSVDIGTHQYMVRFRFVDGSLSSTSAIRSIATTAGNNTVNLSAIPTSSDPNCNGRLIYRTKAASPTTYYYLVTTINDNITTTYTDIATDASLGTTIHLYTHLMTPNNTGGVLKINGTKIFFSNTINTYFGSNAGGTVEAPFYNTAIGVNCLSSLSGLNNNNTAVGYSAGLNLRGNYASLLGTNAGSSGGNGLVAVGYAAFYLATGTLNTGVGYLVGYSPAGIIANQTTTGAFQTLLGANTGQASTTARNYLSCIGYYAVGDESNLMVLGASGANGNYATRVSIGGTTAYGNLDVWQPTTGIGTAANALSGTTVTGTGTFFLNTFKIGDAITIGGETQTISAIASNTSMTTGAWASAHTATTYTLTGGNRFTVLGNGNVGIGTTTPTVSLQVAGAATTGLKVGTTANITIDTVNAVRLNGNATVWDDLFMPFATGNSGGTGYPTFNADSMYYSFLIDTTGVTKCIEYYWVQMPHRWKIGSTIEPHIHYKNTTGQGTPTFKVKYKIFPQGSTTSVAWKWYDMATTTGTTNNTHQIVDGTNGISMASVSNLGCIVVMQVYLSATSGATKTCDAYQFDIHYEIDALGSKDEYVK